MKSSFHSSFPAASVALLYVLSPALPAAAGGTDESPDTTLQQVTVVGERAGVAWNPQSARGATRTDTPLAEVPQSVRVIDAQQIADLGATRMADTVDFVSGIARLNDFGGT
ncbi:outer membrane receptor protein involved in Fe transport [Massilia sp. MP_M2]|uniref:hypothetical protein n=1 Tax=Massilia sp. MP_M2 TaxID=3071713 RepID=UPI00319E1CF3